MANLRISLIVSAATVSLFLIQNSAVFRQKHAARRMEKEAIDFYYPNLKAQSDAALPPAAADFVRPHTQKGTLLKGEVALDELFPAQPSTVVIPLTDAGDWQPVHTNAVTDNLKTDPFKVFDTFKPTPPDSTGDEENPNDRVGDATTQEPVSPMWLQNPSNMTVTYELAPDGKGYFIYERVGNIDVRPPSYISLEDYLELRRRQDMEKYYKEQSLAQNKGKNANSGLIPTIELAQLNDVFGGGAISITPTGSATLQFSVDRNRIENPSLPIRQQKNTFFNFDQQLQVGVRGNIGDKLNINLSQDTKATFDFENITKIDYKGDEDQILQRLETGMVSMTLGNSLIQGSQNLFGVKAELKFGPVNVMGLMSMERGQKQRIKVKGTGNGLQVETPFKKSIADYDANRHFFLGHYFRSKYDEALARVPQVYSRFNITQIEVWVTNQNFAQATNLRPAIGFIDMGESNKPYANGKGVIFNPKVQADNDTILPDKSSNNLFKFLRSKPELRDRSLAATALENSPFGLVNGVDFQLVNVRKLIQGRDFQINPQLGYISLNSPLQSDDALFVSYSYTYDDKAFQVGEFSNDVPGDSLNSVPLFLKMIRPTQFRPTYNNAKYPVWDLMMKNIYNISYGLKPDGFRMQVMYETGTRAGKINALPQTQDPTLQDLPLLQLTGMDRLTNNTAPEPDNLFDFVEGLTVVSDRGYVIFPHIEPFGKYLAKRLGNPKDSSRYAYQPLYDMTYMDAIQQFPELNRYTLEGVHMGGGIGASGGAEIPLNAFGVTPQSVTVKAGGVRLQPGVDYDVDASGSKVIIKNPAYLAQASDLEVEVNSQQAFQMQTRSMSGFRADYSPFKNTKVGFTALRLNERPMNLKNTLGEEPLRNTIWGFDVASQRELPFLTKWIDKLPFFTTKAPSTMNFLGEWAQFKPGLPRQVTLDSLQGLTFIDDFEASKQSFSLSAHTRWKLASFPQHLPADSLYDPRTQFPGDSLAIGFSRAKLSWYQIDPQVYMSTNAKIPQDDRYNSYTRPITIGEIYRQRTVAPGTGFQPTLDLHYYPKKRGPYNFQSNPSKINGDGELLNPKENWAGIMVDVNTNIDFEAQNVEFIEFWMLDPFLDQFKDNRGGKLHFHLGNVSEDVIPDNLQFFENGLPERGATGKINTVWGTVGATTPATNQFSNDTEARINQDVGLDGIPTDREREKYAGVLDNVAQNFGTASALYQEFYTDPSNDDYAHHISKEHDDATAGIFTRYEKVYGTEANSPIGKVYNGLTQQYTAQPDIEDINRNGSPNTWEEYFDYPIEITPQSLQPGRGYVVDKISSTVALNTTGTRRDTVTWYQFRIPIRTGIPVNNIPNFKVINYLRMVLTGFEDECVLRLADLQTVSTQWRKFEGSLYTKQDSFPTEPCGSFEIGSVSIEDNSNKTPFNYVSPPGTIRQGINGNTVPGLFQDERSLLMRAVCLQEGEGRGMFKYVNQDFRNYKRLRLWVHAEDLSNNSSFDKRGDGEAFIRLGLDNDYNYYEYTIPLTPSIIFNAQDAFNADSIWKNQFNFELQKLLDAKYQRDLSGFTTNERFTFTQGLPPGHKITIRGVPKLSDVRVIMIGMRNPEEIKEGTMSFEMWVNELSLTKLDNASAWAANASLNLQLADVGTIQANYQQRTAGFGPIDMRIAQRTREDLLRYSIVGDFQLHKFFPQKWGLSLPLHANWDEQIKNPVFDPRQADVETKELYRLLTPAERKETKMLIQDYTSTRGFSFNNVKKNKTGKNPKAHIWDVENFDASFAYSEILRRDYMTERNYSNNYRGALNYRYNIKSPNIQPFKKWKKKNLISEFNFSPLPKSFSVGLVGDRQFSEYLYRAAFFGGKVTPVYTKNFVLTRNYTMAWDLTKSLALNFTAQNNARVDEVKGYWDRAQQWQRDSIGNVWENLFHFGRDTITASGVKPNGQPYTYNRVYNRNITMGRTIGYNHNISLAYTLPFSKFKWTDWVTGNGTYSGTFQWANPPEVNMGLGATITNGQTVNATGRLDFNGLYAKWKPLKKILDPQPYKPAPKKPEPPKKGDPKDPNVKEEKAPPKPPVKEEKKARPIDPHWKDKYKLHPPPERKLLKAIIRTVVRLALSLKNVDATYNHTAGTVLPGYLAKTDNMGLDFGYVDTTTGSRSPIIPPSLGFVAGSQQDIRAAAQQNHWITKDSTLSNYFFKNFQSQLTLKATLEPMPGLKIDMNATRSMMDNQSEMIRWDAGQNNGLGGYINTAQQFIGNYTVSYIYIGTAFQNQQTVFNDFSAARRLVSERLSQENPFSQNIPNYIVNGYQNGYYGTSQEVLIPAMLGTYGAIKSDKVRLSPFPSVPLPNWSVNFNPTVAFPQLKETFTSITLKHTYQGTYTVANYNRNVFSRDWNNDGFGDVTVPVELTTPTTDIPYNFAPIRNIPIAQMQERFAPLIGVNGTLKKGATFNLSYNRARLNSFNIGTMQLTEEFSQDITFGASYKKDKLNTHLKMFNKDIHLKNAANFGCQFSLRENLTTNRNLDGDSQEVRGTVAINFNPFIDYVVNNRLNIKLFWQETVNRPLVGSFPNSYRSVGVQVRLSLN